MLRSIILREVVRIKGRAEQTTEVLPTGADQSERRSVRLKQAGQRSAALLNPAGVF